MTQTEERLRDTFEAVRRQVQAPAFEPLDEHRPSTIPRPWLVATAAAVLALVALVLVFDGSDDTRIGTADQYVDAADFDADASELCVAFFLRAPGPQFRTPEAYVVALTNRIDLTYAFLAELRDIGRPEDDPNLPDSVAARLRSAVAILRELRTGLEAMSAVSDADLDNAARVWATVDPELDSIVGDLARHGAEGCAR